MDIEDLKLSLDEAWFKVDFLYDALGPAADDILEMADEAWQESRK